MLRRSTLLSRCHFFLVLIFTIFKKYLSPTVDILAQRSALENFWKTEIFPEAEARKIETSFGL
jgi:hypothetical protein